ncbi:hypothetical protein KSP40_PGU016062 [Platanthera guangdongensis]|uniref:RNase H type-1 domain-containing protein n=1 Tax=Platanthera guangdongensis TaxID=2320717 RepID=A0ABR2LJZ2_9ASPA
MATLGGEAALPPARMLCYAAYQCWRARNAKIHNREVGSPIVIAATILENITLFDHGRKLGCWSINRPLGLSHSSLWCPPPPGWIKVNVDGSLLLSGSAGLGVVARSDDGRVLIAAGFAWHHWDPGRVELEAILLSAGSPFLRFWRLGALSLRGMPPMCWTSVARRLRAPLACPLTRGMSISLSSRSLRLCAFILWTARPIVWPIIARGWRLRGTLLGSVELVLMTLLLGLWRRIAAALRTVDIVSFLFLLFSCSPPPL